MDALIKTISLGRFVLALVIALVMWSYIQLTQFPENTVNFPSVPLTVIQPPTGYTLAQTTTPSSISVDVRGTADAMRNIVPNNIVATLDLSHFSSNTNADVPIDFSKTPHIDGVSSITATPVNITVHIEQQISKSFSVNYNSKGTVANSSSVGIAKLTPDQVTVTGPKSLVDQVDKANVLLDISYLTSSVTNQSGISLTDKNGLPIQDKDLKISPATVEVQLPISSQYVTKLVPVQIQTKNTAADGYVINSVKADPAVVTIFGLPDVISNTVVINTIPVDISGASSIVTTMADLIIPGGVVPSLTKAQVSITFGLLGIEREVIVPVEFQNLPPGYTLLPTSTSISVTLGGSRDALSQLPISDVRAVADMTGKAPGNLENVSVRVVVPDEDKVIVKSQQPFYVNVTLVAPPTPTPTPRPQPTATALPLPTNTPVPPPTNTPPLPPTSTPTNPPPRPTVAIGSPSPASTTISTTRASNAVTPTPTPTPAPAISNQITDVPPPATSTRQTTVPAQSTPLIPATPVAPSITPRSVPITLPTVRLTEL